MLFCRVSGACPGTLPPQSFEDRSPAAPHPDSIAPVNKPHSAAQTQPWATERHQERTSPGSSKPYHCFDRMVINGDLSGLSRPEQVVHFVRAVMGIPIVSKEVLSQRTNEYQNRPATQTVNSKPLITELTRRWRTSFTC
jgi:hypothetical protein